MSAMKGNMQGLLDTPLLKLRTRSLYNLFGARKEAGLRSRPILSNTKQYKKN
jgi:hypothetical protein